MNKFDMGDIVGKIKRKESVSVTEKDVNDFIDSNLTPDKAQAVKTLLGDEEKTKALLNSDAAKALFQKFFGGKKDG